MSHRLERVRDLMMEVGSEVLRVVKDPALGDELISITDVKLSPDLTQARFYVSMLATPDRQEEILKALTRASGFFRREIRGRVRLKRIPEVHFERDLTLERASHLMEVLDRVRPEPLPVPAPSEEPSE